MAAMSIYKILRKTERFGVSFRVCDSKGAGVGSCDQFLTELGLRDSSVYTQRAYALGLAHFFSWLRTSGCDPDQVTRQIVGIYITEFVRGAKQGAISTDSAKKPRSHARSTIGQACSRLILSTAFAAIPRTGGVRGKVASTQPPGTLSPKSYVTG
jgi:hypothetical protein